MLRGRAARVQGSSVVDEQGESPHRGQNGVPGWEEMGPDFWGLTKL